MQSAANTNPSRKYVKPGDTPVASLRILATAYAQPQDLEKVVMAIEEAIRLARLPAARYAFSRALPDVAA